MLSFKIFEQLALVLKNRVALEFSRYWNIFNNSGLVSNSRLPSKTELPSKFSLYWICFLHSGFLSNLRLPWETECALNWMCWICIFYHLEFLSNLRLPWKTELPWKFSLYWNVFYHSGILSNLRLPWKQSLPWNFSSPGERLPPPRHPASYAYEYTPPTSWWKIFMYFLEYWLKNFVFRQFVNSMQNQMQSTKRHSAINLLATPGPFQCLSCISFR